MQKPVPLCPECHSEATSEICVNLCNLWIMTVGFSAVRAVEYPFYDGNGNITDWMDADGTLAAHHEYDPYGNEITGETPTSFGFSTKPLDSTLNLYYYGYRFYRPEWDRWINRDPIGEYGGDNLYNFANNSSVYGIDFLGLQFSEACCKQSDINNITGQDPYKSMITDLRGKGCLGDISCGKCSIRGAGAEYNPKTGNITICSKVSEIILRHELQHAKQCDGYKCGGTYPTREQCSAALCAEIEAYVCGDQKTGSACDTHNPYYDEANCINRAWEGSVLSSCPGCRRFNQGDIYKAMPNFPVGCAPKSFHGKCAINL